MSGSPFQEILGYVRDLKGKLGADLPPGFEDLFYRYARHLRSGEYEDLAHLAIAEYLDARQHGTSFGQDDTKRLLDKITHRLVRDAERNAQLLGSEALHDAASDANGTSIELKLEELRRRLQHFSPDDLLVFDLYCLEGRKLVDVADSLSMSPAGVSRSLKRIEELLMNLEKGVKFPPVEIQLSFHGTIPDEMAKNLVKVAAQSIASWFDHASNSGGLQPTSKEIAVEHISVDGGKGVVVKVRLEQGPRQLLKNQDWPF